ncbi:MAG: CoA pyrophosphatase [Bacteroidia bacterium]|nr:CoA pyrophosphatase [Bacteroidia bacterium]
MKFSEIALLKEGLKNKLPGVEAQFKMASSLRFPPDYIEQYRPKARQGSVMVLLYPIEDVIHTVLTLRTSYKGVHSGQVSFPGGKREESDENLIKTALRETWEEVGVPDYDIEVIGGLTELYIPASNFIVTPYVGIVQEKPEFQPNRREVERILEADLALLLDDKFKKQTQVKINESLTIDAPYFDIEGQVVWGATAMMLSELAELIRPHYSLEKLGL